eukprot:gene43855-54489_t
MSLEEALTTVEQHIEKVSTALLALDAPSLETASTALRDAAARFTWVLEQAQLQKTSELPPQFQQRVAAIGQNLSMQHLLTQDLTPTISGTGTEGDIIQVTMPGTGEILSTT